MPKFVSLFQHMLGAWWGHWAISYVLTATAESCVCTRVPCRIQVDFCSEWSGVKCLCRSSVLKTAFPATWKFHIKGKEATEQNYIVSNPDKANRSPLVSCWSTLDLWNYFPLQPDPLANFRVQFTFSSWNQKIYFIFNALWSWYLKQQQEEMREHKLSF